MSSNTKIVVLRSKELVYALVLLVVSVLIIMVAVSLFLPAKDSASPAPAQNADTGSDAIADTVTDCSGKYALGQAPKRNLQQHTDRKRRRNRDRHTEQNPG